MKTKAHFLYSLALLSILGLVFQRCLWTPERIEVPCFSLSDISPDGANFGDTVTISGAGFLQGCPELYTVSINGQPLPQQNVVAVPDENSLRFVVPKGSASGPVAVSLINMPDCQATLNKPFTYYYTAMKVALLAGTLDSDDCPTSQTSDFFKSPAGLDFDENTGTVVVADKFHHLIRVIQPAQTPGTQGSIIRTFGKIALNCPFGCNDALNASSATFDKPVDIEVDLDGYIYVMEESGNAVMRLIKPVGSVEVYAGACQMPAPISNPPNGHRLNQARLVLPMGVTKQNGEIYFTDAGSIRKITGDIISPFFTKASGSNYRGIEFSNARLGEGPIFVADDIGNTIRFFTVNGAPGVVSIRNSNLSLSRPVALTLDSRGNIFIADRDAHRIFVVYTNGELVSLAGTGAANFVDGVPGNQAQFDSPSGITMDKQNQILYVSDGGNQVVRSIVLE